ncbi:MAG: hypothetical protein ATN35_12785 [Epulopiscium sp. Nele67-Bin004]|nr:MAG: hypothetical protein ATN35_12785 [Epulopiscium sp. Nele67-Bin004]
MKKFTTIAVISATLITSSMLLFADKAVDTPQSTQSFEKTFAYIKFDGDTVQVDPIKIFAIQEYWEADFDVDFVTSQYHFEHLVEQVGVAESHYDPYGYSIYNETGGEEYSLSITTDTTFEFTDFTEMFVSSGERYITNDAQQFIDGSFYRYQIDKPLEDQGIPYEIHFLDGEVIKIIERSKFALQ